MIRPRKNRVVITGMGVLAANGTGIDEFWSTLLAGKSGIGPITLFDASDLACRIAGEVKGFDPADYIDPALKPKRMGRFTQLGVAAAREALSDARVENGLLKQAGVIPVVMGVSTSAMDLYEAEPRMHTAVAGAPVALASAVAYMLDAPTRLTTISNGCASSLDAIAAAAGLIQSGETDFSVAGGGESGIVPCIVTTMLKCRKCSMRNDDPQAASRPFDRLRDYGVLAEGAGVITIENLEFAKARGAPIYAEIVGYGTCTDPQKSPEGGGFAQAMELALLNGGFGVESIDFISAHGPSDIQMDIVETEAIKALFKNQAYRIPITSIKGATGCPMSVGGVLQVIAAALGLERRTIPPTANLEEPDPACDLDYVSRQSRHAAHNLAMINTHGFGRGNSSLLLQKTD